ncbi:unnamed protein product [Bursaphelenchus okinawaensis]|uniref:Phorbol-ester/DAG-type domain-containing protein n=1 Tax=Bursaphelenchus okinawaensis TaxID=465554 RepID=A0A811LJV4_9BILA|nr:unnamed protein product [Bursaphelenchus okinawaensis]CAG9127301.1 unnamed protein product [Bursaphelenchus okinawaensis]
MGENYIVELEDFHRRISTFQTDHFDREVEGLGSLARELAERERDATAKLIEEKNKNDAIYRQNKEIVKEVEKLRRELTQKNKLLAELKSDQMALKMSINEKPEDSAEVLELRKRVTELTHRLQTRTDENQQLNLQLEQYKNQCECYKKKCIEMENGRHGYSDTSIVGSLQHALETEDNLNKQLNEELDKCRARCAELEKALQESITELDQVRTSSQTLTKELEEQGQSMDEVHKILGNEISLVKQQKAKLRCDFLKLKSDLVAKERELETMEKAHKDTLRDLVDMQKDVNIEKKLRQSAVNDLEVAKKSEKELREKLEKIEAESKGETEKLNSLIVKLEDQTTKLKDFVRQQDKQCEELANQVQFFADEMETWKQKCASKTDEIAELRRRITNVEIQKVEMDKLKEELGRTKDKMALKEREVKTLHVEYRGELADLTKKLALAQKENFAAPAKRPVEEKLNVFVENQKKQLEQELAAERRLLKERTAELNVLKREKDNSSMESDLKRKTMEAAKALNDAVIKLQAKNEELSQIKSEKAEKEKELERIYCQLEDREEDLHELRNKFTKTEETMLYWKNMYERRLQPAASESDDASVFTQEPLDKENRLEYDDEEPIDSDSSKSQTLKYGMMRHEIAHRFKRVWMAMQKKSYECARCRENLPAVSTAAKCRDCNIYAHLACARRMGKTCGLPADYAQLYVDAVTEQNIFAEQHQRSTRYDERMDTM